MSANCEMLALFAQHSCLHQSHEHLDKHSLTLLTHTQTTHTQLRESEIHLLSKAAFIKVMNMVLVFAIPPVSGACFLYIKF